MEKWLNSIYTDGSKYFVSNPLPKKGEEIKIFLRCLKDAPIDTILLRTKLNGVEQLIEMHEEYDDEYLKYYSSEVLCFEDMLHYHFYIISKEKKVYYYNQKGIIDYIPDEVYDFKILYDYEQPSWVRESVFYQIFPERFCNGNKENDVKSGEYTFDGYETIKVEDWNSVPKEYNESHCLDFYGGDLEGVRKKIPYLKKLGVNALYLNPIFYAATVHKYDCLDYFHIDPHFGGDKGLEELVQALHDNDMRIILDISINHTGTANKWFNKEENPEAYILAEDWCDVWEFLKGNEWDSAMNYYGCARPIREFVGECDLFARGNTKLVFSRGKLTAKNLANRIKEHLCKLPFVIQENQFNLIDSHDVHRLHNNIDEIRFNDYRGAIIMMFTLIGAPSIYYGDEAGIDGRINSVEGCRYPMCWDKDIEGTKYYELYSKLAKLKNTEDALKYGGFKIISDDDYVFAYARFNMNDVFISVCSTDDVRRNIRISTKIFGKNPIIKEEVFGAKLLYEVDEGEIILSVEPNKSYLIKL